MRRAPILIAALAAGAQTLLAQTVLIREHLLLYGGNEVALGAFLGLWLAGIVAGAIGFSRVPRRLERLVAPLLIAQGVLPIAAIVLARTARGLSGVPAYEPFPLTLLLIWSVPIAIPVSLATGALVPALAARARAVGEDVTGIYVAEAIGALLGGVGATGALAGGVDPATLVLACAAIGAGGVIGLTRRHASAATAALALAAVAALLGPSLGDALRAHSLAAVLPDAVLVDHAETPAASLWLADLRGQRVLLIDGRIVAAFPDAERVERRVGLLAAITGSPRRVLLVGTDAIDLVPGLPALTALDRVVWLVPDHGVAAMAERHLPGVSTNDALEILIGDPARSADELARRGPFDAVWLMVDTPTRRSDDLYLTGETLAQLSRLLTPRGVLAVPVSSGENYVGPRLRLAVGCVVAGVATGLPAVRLLPGAEGLVLGAHDPAQLDLNAERLEATYLAMSPSPRRLDADGFASLLDDARQRQADDLVAVLRRGEPSSLEAPVALFHNLVVRAERDDVQLARAMESLRHSAGILGLPLAVLILFALAGVARARSREASHKNGATAALLAGGMLGMGLNILLLHHYQGRFGTVYSELGWLFGVWMAGLAAGGLLFRRWCRTAQPAWPGTLAFALLAVLAAALAVTGGALLTNRIVAGTAFAVAGLASGAVVPVAEALLARAGIFGSAAGIIIEAADHLGGAACAIGLGVVVIPILGLPSSSWLLAATACFGLLAVGLAGRVLRRADPRRPTSFPFVRTTAGLLALATAAWVGRLAYDIALSAPSRELSSADLSATGLTPPWRTEEQPILHYRAEGDRTPGVALSSGADQPVQGFGGPISLRLALSADGRIHRVAFLDHHETPAYIEGAPALFDALRGLRITAPIELTPGTGQRVDGITGATVTSRAIVTAIGAAGRELSEPVFGVSFPDRERPLDLGDPRFWYLLVSLLLVVPVARWAPRRVRRAWLVAHALVGGVWLGVQLSSVQLFAWLRFEPPLDPSTVAGLLALAVLIAVGFGPLYCGYLCPAGAVQEVLGWLAGARRLTNDARDRFVKYIFLATLVVVGLGLGSAGAARLDLLREVWTANRSLLALSAMLLVGAGSLVVVRFGCRYLCPFGAALNLLNAAAPLTRLLPSKKFGLCDLGVGGAHDIDCIQCNRCVIGERAEPAGPTRRHLFRALLTATFMVLVLSALSAGPDTRTRHSVEPTIRAIDRAVIEGKMASGELSDRKAEYWHVVP